MGKIKFTILALALGSLALPAYGTGKKPMQPPAGPVAVQAIPYRYVQLAPVSVPLFFLPNGQRADLNSDLQTIIDTQINKSRYVHTQNDSQSRLVISGGITSFEVDVLQLNLKIGWNQAGAIIVNPGLPNANGEMDFRLSSFSMDMKIYDRVTKQTYISNSVDQSLGSLKFQVRANIDQITTVLELLMKMKIADTVRTATSALVVKMENDPRFHTIPWEAKIAGVDLSKGIATINAGASAGIANNQVYTLYSSCERGDIGCFERRLVDVIISNSGVNSSEAKVLNANESLQGVYGGDKVLVKILNPVSGI